jgi:hypothetical protein
MTLTIGVFESGFGEPRVVPGYADCKNNQGNDNVMLEERRRNSWRFDNTAPFNPRVEDCIQ